MYGSCVRVSCATSDDGISLALMKDRADYDHPYARLTRNGARMLAKALLAAAEFEGDEKAYGGEGEGVSFEIDAPIEGWISEKEATANDAAGTDL